MKKYGLSSTQVQAARRECGSNALSQPPQKTFGKKLWENFQDPMLKILLLALLVNALFASYGQEDWLETAGIFLAIILAALVSTWSEYSSENAFQKLQAEASRICCRVWRDGESTELPIEEIVVGDAVILAAGDKIPADGFLLDGKLAVDQSALNGESEEAYKQSVALNYAYEADKVDFLDKHKLYRGSVVVEGIGTMRITKVGDNSVYGRLTRELKENERDSPLKLKLKGLAQTISHFAYAGGVLIAVAVMLHKMLLAGGFDAYTNNMSVVIGDLLQAVILAVIIIVMAVPEGLPLMIAIVSSLNMRKMLQDHVLVRKLVGIETAGSLNLLFTDKTGTITQGHLQIVKFLDGELHAGKNFADLPIKLQQLMYQQAVLNTSAVVSAGKIVGGNMTEAALNRFVNNNLIEPESLPQRVYFAPFNSADKYSWAQVRNGTENYYLLKGAPEKLVASTAYYWAADGTRHKFTAAMRQQLTAQMQSLAGQAMRLLAFCTCEEKVQDNILAAKLTLIGVAAIRDDVRPEAASAIAAVQAAGVQVVMITGDRKETAVAIAKEAGLVQESGDLVLASDELAALTDQEVMERLPHLRVVARALPLDKLRLVRLAQELNLVVGMTGDGVNDSPALKKADVGFAMGSGTEVAKEAGDIVILDDNFLSIKKAVLYGRTIYNSICKFIVFQLTINFSAVALSFIAPFIGWENPLTVTQILWVNLVMDTLAALAFGGEPALEAYLQEQPKRRSAPMVSRAMLREICLGGVYITLMAVVFFKCPWIKRLFRSSPEQIYLYTGFFCAYIFMAVNNAFIVRAAGGGLLQNLELNKGFVQVMALIAAVQVVLTYIGGKWLRMTPLNGQEWLVVLGFAALIFVANWLRRLLCGR